MNATMDHIVVNARDPESLLAFYSGVIGLAGERVDAWRAGRVLFPSVRLNADTLIDIFPPELWAAERGPDERAKNVDHFCLCVDASEWDALRRRVVEAGVTIELEPTTLWGAHGEGTSMYVRDPEDNRVELRHY